MSRQELRSTGGNCQRGKCRERVGRGTAMDLRQGPWHPPTSFLARGGVRQKAAALGKCLRARRKHLRNLHTSWSLLQAPEKLARLHGFGFHGTQQRVDHFVEANNLTRNEARLWLRLSGKESTCQSRRRRRYRFNPRSGKSPGGGNDNPLSALAW